MHELLIVLQPQSHENCFQNSQKIKSNLQDFIMNSNYMMQAIYSLYHKSLLFNLIQAR